MSSIIFGGLKGMIEFRKSMEPELRLSLENIRFFTKDYLQRLIQGVVADKLPKETSLPSFYLFADEKEFESLNSDLPSSGKTQYRSGHLKVNDPEFSSKIMFRYRGGLPLHWLYKKKSLRIKQPNFSTFNGEKQFNLVNPSTIHTVTDWLSYDMARSIGLLTPDYFPVRVFINNETNGLHFYLSQIDESFLRKNKRMPGSIYSGDTLYIPNPFGADEDGVNERSFINNESGVSIMWNDYRLWKKDASRNAQYNSDTRDIRKFIEVINLDDPIAFMENYLKYFDTEKFNLFWGLDTLVGSFHHDLYHNHKIYFDPYKGKFEPIEWDVRFWTTSMRSPDTPFLKKIRLNPLLEYQRDVVTFSLLNRFPVDSVINQIDEANRKIEGEIGADPFRQHPDATNKQFFLDKVVPFTKKEYLSAINELRYVYRNRHQIISDSLNQSEVVYFVEPIGDGRVLLNVSVSGNSPIELDVGSLLAQHLTTDIEIQRVFDGEMHSVYDFEKGQLLYPGRRVKSGNMLGRDDLWAKMTFGIDYVAPSPLHYQFILSQIDLKEWADPGEMIAKNAITGNPIVVKSVKELPPANETQSIHPWILNSHFNSIPEEIVLSGDVEVTKDLEFTKYQHVKILPGTTIRLAKDQSMIFYGQVTAIGTEIDPIQFLPMTLGENWGSIVIQGKGASGSKLSYLKVSGGSLSTHRLIDYPGQLNIHDVKSFQLDHCLIENNAVGDDALHIAYSRGVISFCEFQNTAFDAVDMDIAEITISHSSFKDIGNDAIDLMTSKVKMNNLSISGAGDKCFSVGEESDVSISKSNLHNCNIGIAIKDKSSAYVDKLNFSEIAGKAIALYRKNPRYGVGGQIRGKQLHGINENDLSVGDFSKSFLNDDAFLPETAN